MFARLCSQRSPCSLFDVVCIVLGLCRQKNYAEAEKIKRLADTLEARETQKIGQDRKQQIKKLEVCVHDKRFLVILPWVCTDTGFVMLQHT